MKYGFNKWSKVASLLARTPAQCKLRYEQSVRDGATLWSKEDLVRLLELSKRFPSRFELIGSIMKRPALCCYDAYCSICCGYKVIEEPGGPEPMDQFAVELAKAKLENTKSRKDLKRMRQKPRRLETKNKLFPGYISRPADNRFCIISAKPQWSSGEC